MRGRGGILVGLALFAAVSIFIGSMIVGTLRQAEGGPTSTYTATFADATGLRGGDAVRVAGVLSGKVTSVSLVNATTVKVTFTANHKQVLTTSTNASIRYANLLGQRYLALTQPPGATGVPLKAGAGIPESRTQGALSLTALFNGFRPIFASLNPTEINRISTEIVGVLQGQSGTIDSLVSDTADLTGNLADRDELFSQAIRSMEVLLATVSSHDGQLAATLEGLKALTAGLSADGPAIFRSVASVNTLISSVGEMLARIQTHSLQSSIKDVTSISALLAKNTGLLSELLKAFPQSFSEFDRISQDGSFLTAFPCKAEATIIGYPRVSLSGLAGAVGALGSASLGSLAKLLLGVIPGSKVGIQVPLAFPSGVIGNPTAHTAVCPG